jgi:hypothetical protein
MEVGGCAAFEGAVPGSGVQHDDNPAGSRRVSIGPAEWSARPIEAERKHILEAQMTK